MIKLKQGDTIELVPIKYSPISERIKETKTFKVICDDGCDFVVDNPWSDYKGCGSNGALKLYKFLYHIKIINNYDLPEELFVI